MIFLRKFKSMIELMDAFPDEETCKNYLESIFWKDGVVSPFDRDSKVYSLGNHRYMCKNTQKVFNVKNGTIFSNTKLPLKKWFVAIWLMTSNKKGISSLQLSRDIGVTQKTAWYMLHKIRLCLVHMDKGMLGNTVECDETFVGGKNKNRHKDKKVKNSQGRSCKDKTPVLGMVERGGRLIGEVVVDTSSEQISPVIRKFVKPTATLYTDEWGGYNEVAKEYAHAAVDHGKGVYCTGDVTTNRIEGFWTLLKRGHMGIYHSMSKKHLQKYVDEFVFRYNTREDSDRHRFDEMLFNARISVTNVQVAA